MSTRNALERDGKRAPTEVEEPDPDRKGPVLRSLGASRLSNRSVQGKPRPATLRRRIRSESVDLNF